MKIGGYKGDNITMYIDEEKINEIKERADIVNVISDYLPLNKSGANLVGLCPFHNEKTPSFTVSEPKQFFHCFGCGESGDSITFIMKKENLEFIEAVKVLANKLGIELDGEEVDSEELEQKKLLYEINRDTGRFFHETLLKDKEALKYLKNRKIEHRDIKRFGIGFIPDEWEILHDFLNSKGYKDDDIESIGLINKRKNNNGYYDRFRNRIMFPIINRRNRVIGFGGRVLDDSMPKYLNSKESPIFNKGNNLYGLNLVKKYSDKKRIILVEGYMDVIALFSKGIDYSVASLGTALTETQAKLLKRSGEEVYIAYDSDEAGIKATLRIIDILLEIDLKPKIVRLPKNMDPDDYIHKHGKMKFEQLLNESVNYVEYNYDLSRKKYDIENTEEKILFTMEIADLINKIKSPIEQDVYMEMVSKDTGIAKEAIEKEIKTKGNRKSTRIRKTKPKRKNETNRNTKNISNKASMNYKIKSAAEKAELSLIKLMIVDKEYYYLIEDKLSYITFSNLDYKRIYDIINSKYKSMDILEINDIVKLASEEDIDKSILNSIKDELLEYKPTDIEQIISDLVNTLILNSLEQRRKGIIKSIEKLEGNLEKSEIETKQIEKLIMDLTNLNNEIKSIRY